MDGPSLTVAGTPLVGLVERLVIAINLIWLAVAAAASVTPAPQSAEIGVISRRAAG